MIRKIPKKMKKKMMKVMMIKLLDQRRTKKNSKLPKSML